MHNRYVVVGFKSISIVSKKDGSNTMGDYSFMDLVFPKASPLITQFALHKTQQEWSLHWINH